MCAVHGWDATCRCGYAVSKRAACAVGLAAFMLGTACGLLPAEAPEADPCAAEIVRLEAARDAEVAAACTTEGQPFDACLSVAVIDRKYDPLIQAQIRCSE